ncbi:response regulator [Cohnella sp. WQ 127256]|uniref:response regulator n=1 Tax=Cohnella sp. WQ 127256 TaxID=2938790 RepID=UPI00211749C4|nr:response regulator [Cohnella sp. WQ 127256]
MRAILIDDEKPALAQIEWLVERDGRLGIAAKFTSAREGIKYLETQKVDIVFLDIEMPGVNGLEAAEYIQQIDPEICIVYITAYSEYAIEAFDLNALDYLLKPVHPERFKKTITRILDHTSRIRVETEAPMRQPRLTTFKRLAIHDEVTSNTSLKQLRALRTLKAQELFAYLIHNKDKWIPKDQLLETLWPGGVYEKIMALLHTSIYQIRKLLKEWNVKVAIEFALDSYRLTGGNLIVDRELFERETVVITVESEVQREVALRTLGVYTGDYLEEHDYEWAQPRRDELRRRYTRLTRQVAKYEAGTGREADAINRLIALQQQEPYSDEICLLILRIHEQMEDFDALFAYYEQFVSLLRDDLNDEPGLSTKRYIEEMVDQRNSRKSL